VTGGVQRHETAGGVVVDDTGQILVIERDVVRDGKTIHEVRLPKGHIDPGETPEQAAMREVGEESGYWALEIIADLGTAQTEFHHGDKHNVRNERYFLMRLTSPERKGQDVHPDSEEALFTPAWLDPADAESQATYASEKDFVARARAKLQGV